MAEKTPARYKKGLMLTRDNNLIKIHANMTATSYKLVTYFLLKAAKIKSMENISVTDEEMKKVLSIKNKNLKEVIKDECKKIAKTVIEIKSKTTDKWEFIPLIANVVYEDGIAVANINPKLKPYINIEELAGNFTSTDYISLISCNTFYGIRLAEICESWAYRGVAYYSVDEWRNLLGAVNATYNTTSQFRRGVLNPAIKAVNKNMWFTIRTEEIKEGKKTTHIKMIITKKDESPEHQLREGDINLIDRIPVAAKPEEIYIPLTIDAGADTVEEVPEAKPKRRTKKQATSSSNSKQFALNTQDIDDAKQRFDSLREEEKDVVRRMVDQYELSLPIAIEAVKRHGIVYCQKEMDGLRQAIKAGKAIKNKGGYLRKALEEGYAESQEAIEKAKRRERNAKLNKARTAKEDIETYLLLTGRKTKATLLSEKTPEEIAYDEAITEWRKKRDTFRKQMLKLVKEEKIKLEDMETGMEEFGKKYPRPVPPKKSEKSAEEKKDASSIIGDILAEL